MSRRVKWYPTLSEALSGPVYDAFRHVLDFIYETRDEQSPLQLWTSGSGDLEITTVDNPVPGCELSLTRAGWWIVVGTFSVVVTDAAQLFTCSLYHQGAASDVKAFVEGASGTTVTVSQSWRVDGAVQNLVQLQISKEGGAGGSVVDGRNSTITATWQGVGE